MTYQKDLVSIIIPAYNSQNHIIYTLLSVIDQTYPYIETIVVDDGSTDGTKAIVQQFQKKGIRYFYQPNGGSVAAKNTGLDYARGEYIQFLDADDLLGPEKIYNQIAAIRKKPGAMAVGPTRGFPYMGDIANLSEADEIDTDFLYSTNNTLDFLKNLNGVHGRAGMVQPNAYLTPRDIIDQAGPWADELRRSPDDDSEFFCRVLLQAKGLVYVPQGMNYYRRIPIKATLSKRKSPEHAKGALRTIELKTKYLLERENSEEIRYMMARHYANFIYQYYSFHPGLCNKAESNILQLGITQIPIVGGGNFVKISKVIGFKNSLRIRKLFQPAYS